jgi:hypothetical protein
MSTIIAQSGRQVHPDPHHDEAARQRRDRLAKASVQDMELALGYLSMIDPEAFEIALTAAAPPDAGIPEDEAPLPVCRECGAPVGIFPDRSLRWQHFRGDDATSGTQETYDPGHPAEAAWLLPSEDPEEL